MTRATIPQPLRIEQAARDACCWTGEPGRLWHTEAKLPEPAVERWPVVVRVIIWLALLSPVWVGVALLLLAVRR